MVSQNSVNYTTNKISIYFEPKCPGDEKLKKSKVNFKSIGILTLVLVSCSSPRQELAVMMPPLINGLAQPVQLELELTRIPMSNYVENPGQIDSITSDGPFNYEVDNSDIILLGRPKKQLYVLHLWSNGFKETVLLKRTKPILHSFLYLGEAKEVTVKGDFNDWGDKSIVLKRKDNSFTNYVLLRPGEYEYLFVVDGEEILDPYNKDSIQSESRWHSVLTIPGVDIRKSPTLDIIGYDNQSIQLSIQKTTNVYAFWQNTLLDISFNENEVKINIPINALEVEQSFIRVWAENEESFSEKLQIELRDGNVVQEVEK